MSIVTECLKKQKKLYFTYLWRGIIFSIVGIWGGIGVLINGLGESRKNTEGYYLQMLLSKLSERNELVEKIIPYCFSGFFFIIAIIGIVYFFRGALHITPSRSMLGRSILKQKKSYESFNDCIHTIENDLEARCTTFGNVSIGGEWIIENEVMRIPNIKGIFFMDAGVNDYVLCLVDEKQNVWAAGLAKKKDRDLAMAHLQEMVPNAVTGNREAYMEFILQKEPMETESNLSETENLEIQLPQDVPLSFTNIDGIPTSNFSWEDISNAIAILEPAERITVSLLHTVKNKKELDISDVCFSVLDKEQWSVEIQYKNRRSHYKAAKLADKKEAEEILSIFLNLKKLPNFLNWKIEEV